MGRGSYFLKLFIFHPSGVAALLLSHRIIDELFEKWPLLVFHIFLGARFSQLISDVRPIVFKQAPKFSNIASTRIHSAKNQVEREMSINTGFWVGVTCCLAALAIQVFPDAAFRIGINVSAAWLVFGFGVFLILMSAALSMALPGADRAGRHKG